MEINQSEKRKIQTFVRTEPEVDMDKVEKAKDRCNITIESGTDGKRYTNIVDLIAGV